MLRKIIQNFNRYLFFACAVPMSLMVILTLIDVAGRYFSHPLQGAMEVGQLLLLLVCVWSWAHTQNRKGHIFIDSLFMLMPQKARTIVDIVTSVVALFTIGLLGWSSINMTLSSRRLMEWTNQLELPFWPFKAMVFFGAFCLCLELIIEIVDYFKALRRQSHGNSA